MARAPREQVKQVVLVMFVVAGIALAVLNWAAAFNGTDGEPARSFYRPTIQIDPSQLTRTAAEAAGTLTAGTPTPTATPRP